MKKLLGIRISILLAILLLPVCANAVPITIAISGNITSVGGYTQAIPSSIHEGTIFNGTYTYDSLASDSEFNWGQPPILGIIGDSHPFLPPISLRLKYVSPVLCHRYD